MTGKVSENVLRQRLADKLAVMNRNRLNKDGSGIFTTIEYYRKSDGTLYCRSVLSGGTSPTYTTRTETYYMSDGTTVDQTFIFTISYDADGDWIQEV